MTKRLRNQKGEGSRLKEEVIQAAMRLLDRAPGTKLSLRMVAREAGVAAPSIYPHFSDAQGLMTEIVRACWEQMGAEMAQAASQSTAPDAFGRLKDQMAAFVRYAMARPSRYELLFALLLVAGDEDAHLRPAYRQVLESIEQFADESVRLPTGDAIDSTLLVISLAHGRIALAHLAPGRAGNSAANVETFVLDMMERIFRPQAA